MMVAFTESAREQPAVNLTLLTPAAARSPTFPATETVTRDEARGIRGAPIRRGTPNHGAASRMLKKPVPFKCAGF